MFTFLPGGRDGRECVRACVPAFYGNWQLIQLREAHKGVIYVRSRGGQLNAPNAKTPCGMSKRSRLINASTLTALGKWIAERVFRAFRHLHFL